jgi:hypothetical protein
MPDAIAIEKTKQATAAILAKRPLFRSESARRGRDAMLQQLDESLGVISYLPQLKLAMPGRSDDYILGWNIACAIAWPIVRHNNGKQKARQKRSGALSGALTT